MTRGLDFSFLRAALRRDDSTGPTFAEPDISDFEILYALLVNRAAVVKFSALPPQLDMPGSCPRSWCLRC